jgi:hypothetical protein
VRLPEDQISLPWREVPSDEAWAPFTERFAFRPDLHEHAVPAIDLPGDALVLDLASTFEDRERFSAARGAVAAAALRAMVWLGP